MDIEKRYICTYCEKEYSSYKSLWNHNNKYHTILNIKKEKNVAKKIVHLEKNVANCSKLKKDNTVCSYCNKKLCTRMYRWKHEKKCKIKIENTKELDNTKIEKLEKEIEDLKTLIKTNKFIGTKINNKINNNINNGQINNINIVGLGLESIKSLTEDDKLKLLKSINFNEFPIVELVRQIYNDDKFKDCRNTYISNLQNKTAMTYNDEKEKFEATNKKKLIQDIINIRKIDVENMYNQYNNSDKINEKTKIYMLEYLQKLLSGKDKKYKQILDRHQEEIVYIIYNCKDFMKTLYESTLNEESIENNIEI